MLVTDTRAETSSTGEGKLRNWGTGDGQGLWKMGKDSKKEAERCQEQIF